MEVPTSDLQERVVVGMPGPASSGTKVSFDWRAWLVVAFSFTISFFLTGFSRSSSKFSPHLAREWPEADSQSVALVFSLVGSMSLVLAPLTSFVVPTFGHKLPMVAGSILCAGGLVLSYFATSLSGITLTLGVFVGTGSAVITTSVLACIGKRLPERKPLAISLALSGGIVGGMCLPSGVEACIAAVGFRWTLLVMALPLLFSPLILVFYEDPLYCFTPPRLGLGEILALAKGLPRKAMAGFRRIGEVRGAMRDRYGQLVKAEFAMYCVAAFLLQLGSPGYRGYLSQQALSLGFSAEGAARFATYAAVGDLAARLGYGIFGGRRKWGVGLEFAGFLVLCSGSIVCMAVIPQPAALMAFTVFGSGVASALAICWPVFIGSRFGSSNATQAMGLVKLFQGIASLVHRPVFAGLRALGPSFALGGCAGMVLAGTLIALFYYRVREFEWIRRLLRGDAQEEEDTV